MKRAEGREEISNSTIPSSGFHSPWLNWQLFLLTPHKEPGRNIPKKQPAK